MTLKRGMSESEWESEVIEIDTDITDPGASKKTKRTVTDRLIKNPSHEDFVTVWNETVLVKGLTFDFFSDPLVFKTILVTVQCADSIITFSSTQGKVLASSWTKHSATWNMTMSEEGPFPSHGCFF